MIFYFIYSIAILRAFPTCKTLESLAMITGTTDRVFEAPEKLAVQLIAQDEPAEDRPEM